jgi:hypothetical protein
MIQEKWHPIKGYEGYYEIHPTGDIKSLERKIPSNNRFNKMNYSVKERILKPNVKRYAGVTLVKDGIKKYPTVHRLVAETFIPNPDNKKTINHKDGNKLNNNTSNLEWSTHSENVIHSYYTLHRKTNKGMTYNINKK